MTFPMWDELVAAFTKINADPTVRCVVLTGAGRGFCAGRDFDEAAASLSHQPLTEQRLKEMHHALIPAIVDSPAIVVGAINGVAVGVGLSLALACDLRIASSSARFGVGFLAVGLTPDAGATFLLERSIGYPRALELCATGELVGALRALELGLVERLVEPEELEAEVTAFAKAVVSVPALALAETKRLLKEAPKVGLSRTLDLEAEVQPRLLDTSDYRERIESFARRHRK